MKKIDPDQDRRPGEPPLIRSQDGSIIFDFPRGRLVENARLVVRCDADGEVWVAIVPGS